MSGGKTIRTKIYITISIILPLLLVSVFSYINTFQYKQIELTENRQHLPHDENAVTQLKYGWSFYTDNADEQQIVQSTPFTLKTDDITTFTIQLQVPKAEQIYSLNFNGIQHPFEFWVNDKLIKDMEGLPPNKLLNFYTESTDVTIKLVITPTTNRIAILQTPLIGQNDPMQNIFIRNLLIMLTTLVALTILGIYSIVLYFSKQRQVFHLHIGMYFLLISSATFLSSSGIGTIFLSISPNILIKVKAVSGLLAAIPLYMVTLSFSSQPLTKKKLYFFSSLAIIIFVLILALPFDLYRLLEFLIWSSLIVLLLITFIKVTIHLYKNKLFSVRNLVLSNTLLYLFIYLVLRMYYNIWGTDLPTSFWLVVFAISICLYLTLYQNHLVDELDQSKRDAIESRISFFNAQIKPHFIYNALSNIIALCYTDNRRAAKLLGKFSTFLRLIFENNKPNEWITLEKELTLIDAYVEIEKARFPDKISYSLQVEEDAKLFKIPPLSIQPFVENAIRHGLFNKMKAGNVALTIKQQQETLIVTVQDDGIGMTSDTISCILNGTNAKQGIGILNVVQRLKFVEGSEFNIQSTLNEGTCVTMKIPLQ